ncbi:hypothetical protein AVEN_112256-1 [Araneus ventricosus]|uniref:Uncharacterized protein n=1 Tax=Araneus ventricosus TaxID=182803 RepID=A0A4Y2LGK5_ARAVE|nr:hypothetical protein AVEN_112256-1 [Araneus ventricosus]
MESRFPSMLVLWLRREFYRGKYEMTDRSHATQHTLLPRTSPRTYFAGGCGIQRRSRRCQSTHKGRPQEIECPPKFLLSIALRCPSREVGNISEIADAGGFTDAGHGMEARLRFKGPFS